MLMSQQHEALERLVATLIDIFGIRHVSDSEREALGADENWIGSDDGRFGVSVDSLRGFLDVSLLYSDFSSVYMTVFDCGRTLEPLLLTVSKHSRQRNFDLFFSTSVAAC